MTNFTTEKLSWFDRIKKEIEGVGAIKKMITDNVDVSGDISDAALFGIHFNEADLIPSFWIYSEDASNRVTYKVDEERGEIYKEIYRLSAFPAEPTIVRVVFSSVSALISDMCREMTDGLVTDDFISGWCSIAR